MTAEIICVGTELLLGDIVNTNAQFISRKLSELGISVYNQQVVGDNPERLRQAATIAKQRSDIVIYSGGLGPTDDDITKQTVASVYNDKLVFNQRICDNIQDYFKHTGRVMTENNKRQAYVPERGRFLENNYGTAPGIVFIDGEKLAILMPGVPKEMRNMMEHQVMPMLSKLVQGAIVSRYIKVVGIGESALEEKIHLLLEGENPTAALYANEGEVTIRITALAQEKSIANDMLDKLYEKIDSVIHKYIYGVDVDNIESVIVNKLKFLNKSVATAESCTGGLLSSRITSVSGASEVFSIGACTYSNEQKHNVLGVSEKDLEIYTAVSSPVVCQMAQGIRKKSGADYAVATTGYAGPSGGTPQEPVGTVYVAVATRDKTFVKKCSFSGTRQRITYLATQNALDLLRCVIDNLHCDSSRIIDDYTDDFKEELEEKPKKKRGFFKAVLAFISLIALSLVIAFGYLWLKHDGNLKLNKVDYPSIVHTITSKVNSVIHKAPKSLDTILTNRQSNDFFSSGFEKSTVKMIANLGSQNPNIHGWMTFKNSKKEFPIFKNYETVEDGGVFLLSDSYINDYKYVSGFTVENIFDFTNLNSIRENSSFVLFDDNGWKDFQIFAVGTFSSNELDKLYMTKDKQEFIVEVRARSIFDVDIIVNDSNKIISLVQDAGKNKYAVAFAIEGNRNVFPSVDTKSVAIYSDWYMKKTGLTNENAADAILYAQEVYDRDNWHSWPVEELLDSPSYPTTSIPSENNSVHIGSSSNVIEKPAVSQSSKPNSDSVNPNNPAEIPKPIAPKPTNTPTPPAETKPTEKPDLTPTPGEEILTVTMNGQVVSGPATQILSQIVAIEMSSSWNPEALKAQAVATHTFIEYEYNRGVKAPSVSGRTSPSQRIVNAVSQVSNQIITIGGRPAYAPYCASVSGRTNPPSQVWGTNHSHLQSVESKYDYQSPGFEKVYTISLEQMKGILEERLNITLDEEQAENWFSVVDYTDGGYVRRMKVGDATTYIAENGNTRNITGYYFATDIMADAGIPLRSAAFTINYADGNFTIVTQGYGHGVGMSQWGAQLYAQNEGWSYSQILNHYYTGVTIQSIK